MAEKAGRVSTGRLRRPAADRRAAEAGEAGSAAGLPRIGERETVDPVGEDCRDLFFLAFVNVIGIPD
jgi:hypothetical protein